MSAAVRRRGAGAQVEIVSVSVAGALAAEHANAAAGADTLRGGFDNLLIDASEVAVIDSK